MIGPSRKPLVTVVVLALAAGALTLASPAPSPALAVASPTPEFELESNPAIITLPFLSARLDASPSGPQDFTYTGCKGTDGSACTTFTLDDDDDPAAASARTADGLAPGLYTITQDPVPNWTVTAINCSNTSTEVVDLANRRVTVDLPSGQGVFCTFSNRTRTIRIRQDTTPDDPADFAYTGCREPAACGTFTLDDDRDGTHPREQSASVLAPGTYTVSQSGDDRWPLTALTCDRPEAISLGERRVTIDLERAETVTCTFTNRTQSITIEQDTEPDSGADVEFLGCMGSACGPTTLDDDQEPTLPRTTTARGLAPGTYTVTQADVPGHDLRALECSTDEVVDLVGRRVTITLEPLEDVWCTFRNRLRLSGATQVSAGYRRTCAVVTGGQVRCWGVGALGDGRDTGSSTPVVVSNVDGSGPLTGAVQVSVGALFSCATLDSGEARCWGVNHQGQLGDGTTTDALRPTPVLNPDGTAPLTGIAEVTAGFARACARLLNSEIRCWGYNQDGTLGNAVTGSDALLPITVLDPTGASPLTGTTSVAVGLQHVCASLGSGQARCWGKGTNGELGQGAPTTSLTPVPVSNPEGTAPLTGVRVLSSSWTHTCALLTTGEASCWGTGEAFGTTGHALRPVPVPGPGGGSALPGIGSISAGGWVTCALTGQLLCLGDNQYGGIGDGTTTDRALPVPVLDRTGAAPLLDVVQVSTGYDHACALLASSEVRCWGANGGQLGDGTTSPRTLPVAVVAP
ncbi:MAG: hypothetical protein H6518_09125 [Microthrixaceae bacterium]|nr:hypothetical protein [Microthrixaceae bacterium]